MEKLVEMLQRQMEAQDRRHQEQMERLMERQQEQMEVMMKTIGSPHSRESPNEGVVPTVTHVSTPNFSPFDSTSELWVDYWSRFCTFAKAHSIPDERLAQVFLTNQTSTIYKMLFNLAAQETPPKEIHTLTMKEIQDHMKVQFDPKRFIVRERFKFWTDTKRKPGETIQELAVRIRQSAATCDFTSITDPLDEALRTRFICSIDNEAVLKALFRTKDDELTFARAIEIAVETEDAARVAKETVYGNQASQSSVCKVRTTGGKHRKKPQPEATTSSTSESTSGKNCYRCGKGPHRPSDCRYMNATCNYCKIKGHLQAVCRKKSRFRQNEVRRIEHVRSVSSNAPKLQVPVCIDSTPLTVQLDTATGANFLSKSSWKKLGEPKLDKPTLKYQSASLHDLPVIGTFVSSVSYGNSEPPVQLSFNVCDIPNLDLLGRSAIRELNISLDELLGRSAQDVLCAISEKTQQEFNPELGCLRDF